MREAQPSLHSKFKNKTINRACDTKEVSECAILRVKFLIHLSPASVFPTLAPRAGLTVTNGAHSSCSSPISIWRRAYVGPVCCLVVSSCGYSYPVALSLFGSKKAAPHLCVPWYVQWKCHRDVSPLFIVYITTIMVCDFNGVIKYLGSFPKLCLFCSQLFCL